MLMVVLQIDAMINWPRIEYRSSICMLSTLNIYTHGFAPKICTWFILLAPKVLSGIPTYDDQPRWMNDERRTNQVEQKPPNKRLRNTDKKIWSGIKQNSERLQTNCNELWWNIKDTIGPKDKIRKGNKWDSEGAPVEFQWTKMNEYELRWIIKDWLVQKDEKTKRWWTGDTITQDKWDREFFWDNIGNFFLGINFLNQRSKG